MEKGPIQFMKSIPTSLSPPTFNKEKGNEEKARKVCREFESLFWQEIFKMMRKMTWGKGWGSNSGYGNEIYQTILEQEVSRSLALKKGLGIGDLIYKQISHHQKNKVPPSGEGQGKEKIE